MIVSMIVAYGKNWEIGLDNKMLWHISEDFKNFKNITTGHHLIMGRKTFESIGKPLPNRVSIVLSKSGFSYENVHTYSNIKEALDFCKTQNEAEVFIIGGALVYELAFEYVDKLYLSEVDYKGEADAFLKAIDFSNWKKIEEKSYDAIKENDKIKSLAWKFKIYEKKQ